MRTTRAANENTTRFASRWCLSYCLAAPCEMGSVFHYASVSPSHNAGCLLSFLVDVNLAFLQSPSAQSAYHLSKSLTVDVFSISHFKCISTAPLNIFRINCWHRRMACRATFNLIRDRQAPGLSVAPYSVAIYKESISKHLAKTCDCICMQHDRISIRLFSAVS
jgi:hypothetical protein